MVRLKPDSTIDGRPNTPRSVCIQIPQLCGTGYEVKTYPMSLSGILKFLAKLLLLVLLVMGKFYSPRVSWTSEAHWSVFLQKQGGKKKREIAIFKILAALPSFSQITGTCFLVHAPKADVFRRSKHRLLPCNPPTPTPISTPSTCSVISTAVRIMQITHSAGLLIGSRDASSRF